MTTRRIVLSLTTDADDARITRILRRAAKRLGPGSFEIAIANPEGMLPARIVLYAQTRGDY